MGREVRGLLRVGLGRLRGTALTEGEPRGVGECVLRMLGGSAACTYMPYQRMQVHLGSALAEDVLSELDDWVLLMLPGCTACKCTSSHWIKDTLYHTRMSLGELELCGVGDWVSMMQVSSAKI